MYVYASELRKFWHFYILKLLFLSIFCRYIRYFAGTNDMPVIGLHVPTNFQMYRQKPSGYANGVCVLLTFIEFVYSHAMIYL